MANSLISQVKIGSTTYDLGRTKSADKLSTARSISLDTAVTSTPTNFDGTDNISIPVTGVKEAYLNWGGRNISGGFGPTDAAMIPWLGANRFAFMPLEGVEYQYSRDGGATWSEYGTSDGNKINLFNGNASIFYIGSAAEIKNVDRSQYQFRAIITANLAKVYTILRKFCIYCSTGGSNGCWCTIDAKTHANVNNGADTWKVFANKVPIYGWPGYNIINTDAFTTYGNADDQYQKLRFTFGVTSHPSSSNYLGLSILNIMGFGGIGWRTPSDLAATGSMYTYDYQQNVYFPAGISATSFNGNLSGNADSASALLAPAMLDSQEKIDNFITPSKLQYGLFKTTEANNIGAANNDGMLISVPWTDTKYGVQIALDGSLNSIKIRCKYSTWNPWITVLNNANYIDYSPTKTGSGASGTWNIGITGNAATATIATQIARGGDISSPMTFNWIHKTEQPTRIWGGNENDATQMYVYDPRNFSVANASKLGNVDASEYALKTDVENKWETY